MRGPILPRRSTGRVKPPGLPRINWNDSITAGLILYVYDTGAGVFELVSNRVPTFSGTSLPRTTTSPYGAGFNYTTALTSNIEFSPVGAIRTAVNNPNYTVSSAWYQTGNVASYSLPFYQSANGGLSQPFVNWAFQLNNNGSGQNLLWWYTQNGGALNTALTSTSEVSNKFLSVTSTVVSGGTKLQTLSVNGAQVGTISGVTASGYTTNDYISIGSGFAGLVFYGAMWNRRLSATEITRLYNDPYGFLIYPEDEIRQTIAGINSGGGSFNVSVSESGSASDTVSEVATFLATVSESANAVDLVALVFNKTVSEAASASDTVSEVSTFVAALTEAANAADTTSEVAIFPVTITEAGSASDTTSVPHGISKSVSESVTASDTVGIATLPILLKPQITPPPLLMSNEKEHRRQIAQAVQFLYRGKGPTPIDDFTLNTSATSTTLTDARIGWYSHISFMPQTANAAAIASSLWIPQSQQIGGQLVVQHSSTINADCTFRVIIWG